MRRAARLLLPFAALWMTGCAELAALRDGVPAAQRGAGACYYELSPEQELLLGLSQEMVAEGRLHAALANLQQLPHEVPEVRLRKARILRILDADQAWILYTGLLNTPCYTAAANHGLGQVLAATGNYDEAGRHLRLAARDEPANADIRNDLGVVYLQERRLAEARFELMTALELNQSDPRPAENLLTLLIYQDRWDQARSLIEGAALTQKQFETAEGRARRMKQEDGDRSVEVNNVR